MKRPSGAVASGSVPLRRQRAFGAWTSLGHPSITEIFANMGVDFVGIDLEHSTINQEQAQRLIAAAHASGVACFPRVASHNGEQIKRLLDSGADGIIVPMVSSMAEVKHIVDWCKYPPLGRRPYGVARAHGYGFDFDVYVKTWNSSSTIIIQIESVAGVNAVDDLLSHDAIDGAMIGPYDLAGSLGVPGQLAHPQLMEACMRVIEACLERGKGCGTHLVDPTEEDVRQAFARGYTFVVLGSDVFALWRWTERLHSLISRVRDSAGA